MAKTYKLYGVESGPAAEALAWALWKLSYIQGTPGEVATRCETPGASFNRKRGCWVLHNQAWWHWGGAHWVVSLAAQRLARKAPEVANVPGTLVLVGGTIGVVNDDDERWDRYASLVGEAASKSHCSWYDYQEQRRHA